MRSWSSTQSSPSTSEHCDLRMESHGHCFLEGTDVLKDGTSLFGDLSPKSSSTEFLGQSHGGPRPEKRRTQKDPKGLNNGLKK